MSNASLPSLDSDIPLGFLSPSTEHVVFRYAFAGASFAVNLLVVVVVGASKQLHHPRHIFWAGSSVVILVLTAQWVAELFVNAPGSRAPCPVYELSVGIWYPSLLLFLSLAGLDRYAAIRHYEWYKRKVTSRKSIGAMVIVWLLNALVTDSPYWTGFKTLDQCTVGTVHMNLLFIWNVLLGITNMVLQAKIFLLSRKAIREYYSGRESVRRFSFRDQRVFSISIEMRCYGPGIGREGRRHDVRVTGADSEEHERVISVHCFPWRKSSSVERLDFRAALILSTNVLPFWLFTFPFSLYVMAMYWCSRFALHCSIGALLEAGVYVKTLFFVPCVYMPLMYTWNSGEFRRAVRHAFKKIETRANSANRPTSP